MEKETTKPENLLDKIGLNFHRKLSFKLFTIGLLVLLLLIPRELILSLIGERASNAGEAISEVTSKWSNKQVVSGPVMIIPYKQHVYDPRKEQNIEVIQSVTFLPKNLNIKGHINPKKLYRSIYDVVVYQSEIAISGQFEKPDFESLNIPPENVLWNQAELQLGISDLRGINKEVKMDWSGDALIFSPGLNSARIDERGISVSLPHLSADETNNFELLLDLKGSKSLLFTPVGEKTNVEISSSWNDPGFTGSFLPAHREINEDGFTAGWNVLHFNRNFPQHWINRDNKSGIPGKVLHESDFGVELISVANHYQKNTRSAKYALLIILITFTVFFMFEVFSKQRIHPFQYIMVGSAISLFYLLLLSISEHLGFNNAYLIAALAVVLLVVLYSRTFMPRKRQSLGVGAALTGCFGFIYVLLQLESLALLAGSIGLFVLLAILMYTTRKVNWYRE